MGLIDKIIFLWNKHHNKKVKEDNMDEKLASEIEESRRGKIIATFQETNSYAKTAKLYGISRQRVHQIIRKFATPAKRQYDKKKEKEIATIVSMLEEGLEVKEISEELGLKLQKVYNIKKKHYRGK